MAQEQVALQPFLKVEAGCIACSWCKYNCPITACITFDTGLAVIDAQLCIECSRCIYVCPVDVIIPQRKPQPRAAHV